jgi:hypothetical protein
MITGIDGRDNLKGVAGDFLLTCGQGGGVFSVSAGTAGITDRETGGDTLNVGLHGRAKAFLAGK